MAALGRYVPVVNFCSGLGSAERAFEGLVAVVLFGGESVAGCRPCVDGVGG